MASTIDFSTLNDRELLYGYQRVNRSRFPDNYIECKGEIHRRGLSKPEKFEIEALGADAALSVFQKLGETFASVIGRRIPNVQA